MSNWQVFLVGIIGGLINILVWVVFMRLMMPNDIKRIKTNIFLIFKIRKEEKDE